MTDEQFDNYMEFVFGIPQQADYPTEEVERLWKELRQRMPRGGRFYKYRKFTNDSFKYTLDSLEKGYLWVAQANTLNDDFDSTLNYDPEESVKEIADYIYEHPKEYVQFFCKVANVNMNCSQMQHRAFKLVTDCIDKETGAINERKAVRLIMAQCHFTRTDALYSVQKIQEFVNQALTMNRETAERFARHHLQMNENNRAMAYIFSMSASYDVDSMWAAYADTNNGFCIEYDYSKADTMSTEVKRGLLNTFPVRYGEKKKYSFLPMTRYIFSGQQDKDLLMQTNNEFLVQLLTKSKSWEPEQEWRLLLNSLKDSRFFADLVSGVIIDERAMETENAKRLINLCRERGWTIRIRRVNAIGTAHIYEELK